MILVVVVSIAVSTIVSFVITKKVTIKHFNIIDDYLRECTNQIKETVITIVTKGSS